MFVLETISAMKFKNFTVEEHGREFILHKDSLPRIEFIIDVKNCLPLIKKINPIDDCSASEIAQMLTEIESFLKYIA